MTWKILQRLFLLGVACSQAILPALSEDLFSTSASIVGSKRDGTFIRLVKVEPNSFTWEGHDVAVLESWLEKFTENSSGNALKFKFTIDGDKYAESRISNEKHKIESKNLVLKVEGELPKPGGYNRPLAFTGRRLHDNFFGGLTGIVIHTVRLEQPEPVQVKLRVLTSTRNRKTMKTTYAKAAPTDTLLTFYLADENEKQH